MPPAGMNRQETRGFEARETICLAALHCLAELGYARTTILRIVNRANVSKGALQHHFPTKEDLMTATAERILRNATFMPEAAQRQRSLHRDTAQEIMRGWTKLVDTDEYRALLEILVAIRTDKALQERLSPILKEWNKQRVAKSVEMYESADGSDDHVGQLMTLNICMMRGLVIQNQYNDDPAENLRLMKTWVELLIPLLKPRA